MEGAGSLHGGRVYKSLNVAWMVVGTLIVDTTGKALV